MGFRAFLDFDTPPPDAEVIDVEARSGPTRSRTPTARVSEQLYLESTARRSCNCTRPTCSTRCTSRRSASSSNAVPGRIAGDVVPAHAARRIPRVLHAVLRRRPLADDAPRPGARRGRLLGEAGRTGQHLRRSGDEAAAAVRQGGREAVQEQRLRPVPLASTARSAQGPTWQGLFKTRPQVLRRPEGYTLLAGGRRRQVGRLPPRSRSSIPEPRSSRGTRT